MSMYLSYSTYLSVYTCMYLSIYISMSHLHCKSYDHHPFPLKRDTDSIPRSERSPEGGNDNPLQYLPGESHGQRSLVGYSPWGRKELDITEFEVAIAFSLLIEFNYFFF